MTAEDRSSRSEIWISGKLGAAEGAALVPVADAIGRQRLLCGQGGSGVFFGAAGGPVAVAERRLVVPPGPFVVGRAEEDLEANVVMLVSGALITTLPCGCRSGSITEPSSLIPAA